MTAKIKLNAASGGGSFSLQAPSSSANNRVFTLPDEADATLLTSNTSTGKILQVVSTTKTDVASNSTASQTWWSYTDSSLRATITPSSASNKIYLIAYFNLMEVTGQWLQFRFERDGSDISGTVGAAGGSRLRATGQQLSGQDNNGGRFFMMAVQVDAADTNSRSYNLAFRHTSGIARTLYLNRTGDDTDNVYNARTISTITAMEIAA